MLLLVLALLLQWNWNNPPAGIELRPDDPFKNNIDLLVKCVSVSPGGGCIVRYTPGTYTLYKSIILPNGVIKADFSGVNLIVCANLNQIVSTNTLGPYRSAQVVGLTYDIYHPCGTFTPPVSQFFIPVRPS